MKKTLQLSLLVSTLIASVSANDEVLLKELRVSSTLGMGIEKKDTTESITLITKEDLQEMRVHTLAQALRRVGAISMTQNGGAGQPSSFYIRGMDAKRTLVLIDGVRYNDPTGVGAAAQFEHILLSNVEQIEIIKGAQSGVWGADASGAVINIISSKTKQGFSAFADLEYGSFDTQRLSLQAAYGSEFFDFVLGGTLYDTEGFSAAEPTKADPNYSKRYDELSYEEDTYKNNSLHSTLGINITQNDRIELSVKSIESDIDFDSGAGVDADLPNTELNNHFYTISYAHKTDLHHLKFYYNLSTFDRETALPSYLGVGTDIYKYKGSVEEFGVEDTFDYIENGSLRIGISHQSFEHEELTTDTDKDYSANSVFLSNHNTFKLFGEQSTIINESIRYDNYDAFENALTGKLGLKQFFLDDIYVALNIANGFNAPTLGELYGQWGSNPDLDPEKSLTYDITLGNDILWASYFHNEITDMIEYDMNTWSYVQSSGTSKFKGFELGYSDLFFNSLGITLLYNYVDPKDAAKQTLARRAKEQFDARLIYYVNDSVDLGINAQYVGERYDALNKQGAQTGRYTVANAVINYRADQKLTLYAKVDNITDKYYQTVDGYATAQRSFFIGLNAKY